MLCCSNKSELCCLPLLFSVHSCLRFCSHPKLVASTQSADSHLRAGRVTLWSESNKTRRKLAVEWLQWLLIATEVSQDLCLLCSALPERTQSTGTRFCITVLLVIWKGKLPSSVCFAGDSCAWFLGLLTAACSLSTNLSPEGSLGVRAGSRSALRSQDRQGEGLTNFLQGPRFRPGFYYRLVLSLKGKMRPDCPGVGKWQFLLPWAASPVKMPRGGASALAEAFQWPWSEWPDRAELFFLLSEAWRQKRHWRKKPCRCASEGGGKGRGPWLCRKPEPSCRMSSAHAWSVTGRCGSHRCLPERRSSERGLGCATGGSVSKHLGVRSEVQMQAACAEPGSATLSAHGFSGSCWRAEHCSRRFACPGEECPWERGSGLQPRAQREGGGEVSHAWEMVSVEGIKDLRSPCAKGSCEMCSAWRTTNPAETQGGVGGSFWI